MKSKRNSLRNRKTSGSVSQQDPTTNSYSLHDSGSRTAKSKRNLVDLRTLFISLSLMDSFRTKAQLVRRVSKESA